ncbi:MAG: hypothetical protein NTZ26_12790 [Candidatus Aminicenantes bacterium]|nr:hypothetical protein [Candidatus Aminicenantes bacterium]
MMKRSIVLLFSAACLAASGFGQDPPAVNKAEAHRLSAALARLEKAEPSPSLRPMEFSESELNAYIARRLEESREDVLRDLRLKLYSDNRIEGWLELDFSGHRIPPWIKKRMNLYFAGSIEVRDGSVRFGFKKLFLEKEPMPLLMLDMIIFIASGLGKTDAKGIDDWHNLPLGIRDVKTGPGRFTLWY